MDWVRFGKEMKKARIKKKIQQKDIAKFLDVTSSLISQIENGKKRTNVENVIKINNILELNFFDQD